MMAWLVVAVAQYLIVVIGVAALAFWLAAPTADKRWLAVTGALSGVLAIALTKLGGALYYDPRPFVVHTVHPLFAHAPDNGFPSDHTVAATLVGLTILQRSRRLGIALLLAGAAVGTARVMAHVHSPVDIAGGAAIGVVAVLLARPLAALFVRPRS